MKFLVIEEVIEIHTLMIRLYGGLDGIRDKGLLLSAVEMPKAALLGKYLHESAFDKAAAYVYHIICNHAFFDGNKRTGAAAAIVFLEMNGIELNFDENEYEELVVGKR
jgi:death-on-curing protein